MTEFELEIFEQEIEFYADHGKITKQDYLDGWEKILGDDFKCMSRGIEKDWYEKICQHMKNGGNIGQDMLDSMDEMQLYHWAKHYNRGSLVID